MPWKSAGKLQWKNVAKLKGEDGKTPVPGVDFPLPKDGQDGKDAAVDYELVVKRLSDLIPPPISGDPGKDGVDGKDGKDGKEMEGIEIVDKLSNLPPGDRLPFSALKNVPDVFQRRIKDIASRNYNFLELDDVPKSYAGQGGRLVKVKTTTNGLEFGVFGVGGQTQTDTIYYVNGTTGNDSNTGLTAGTAFKTIQRALNVLGATLYTGPVYVLVADGTYVEQLSTRQIMGNANDPNNGPSVVQIIGNQAAPANCIIQGSGGITFSHINNPTTYILSGFTLKGSVGGAGRGIRVNNSYLRFGAVNIESCQMGIECFANGHVEMYATTFGRNIFGSLYPINILQEGTITSVNKIILTGSTIFPGQIFYTSFLWAYGGIDIYGVPGVTGTGLYVGDGSFVQIQNNSLFKDLNGITGSAALICVSRAIIWLYNAAMNVTFDNCTNPFAAYQASILYSAISAGVGSITYINGTPQIVQLDPTSMAQGYFDNFFGGCTVSFVSTAVKIRMGGDYRYAELVKGMHQGFYPLGQNVFLGMGGLQTNFVPLHIAQDQERIVKLQVYTDQSNGPGQTDVYTVYKDSVATPMTLSITNFWNGSTIANPVDLVAGNSVGLRITTAAGTVARDALVIMKIIKQ